MSRKTAILVAAIAAICVEALVGAMFYLFGHIGGDGPDAVGWVGLIFHFPGIWIADRLHMTGSLDTLFITLTGAIQFFLVFWLVLEIWGQLRTRE
jgi:hypothetical protein